MTTTTSAIDLPFDEAIAYLRQKTNTTSERWTDVFGAANARAFTVAGAGTDALVGDFRKAVASALETGTSLGDFRNSFDAIVKRHGWEHTGTPGWRARVIFETNLGMAYAAGRYAQATEPETLAAFPYWQYVHSGAVHFRPEHKRWDGLILRADDPFWKTHYPPNGWGCGCWVRPVSARQLGRMGKSGPDTAPAIETRPWRNPSTGKIEQVPEGIDPGFDYNPGQQWKAEAVSLPANATLRPASTINPADLPPARPRSPAPAATAPDRGPVEIIPPTPAAPTQPIPPADAATVEDFARRALEGQISDKAASIIVARVRPSIAQALAAPGGTDAVELSAFRVRKVAGRAEEFGGQPSNAHAVSAEMWSAIGQLIDAGEAYVQQDAGYRQVYVFGEAEGKRMMAILRRSLSPNLIVPTYDEAGARRLARLIRTKNLKKLE